MIRLIAVLALTVTLTGCSAQVKVRGKGADADKASPPVKKAPDPDCPEGSMMQPGYFRCEGGKWVTDLEAMKQADDYEKARRALYWALRTRPLTDKELKEVENSDYTLTLTMGVSFNEQEKRTEFNAALLQQYKIRDLARVKGCDGR